MGFEGRWDDDDNDDDVDDGVNGNDYDDDDTDADDDDDCLFAVCRKSPRTACSWRRIRAVNKERKKPGTN